MGRFRREPSLPGRIFTTANTWTGYHSGFSMLLSYGRKDVSIQYDLKNAGAIRSTIYSPRD